MSYAPSQLLKGKAVKGDGTHGSTIFKADVIPRENSTNINVPKWAAVKTVSPGDKTAIENLKRELQSYRLPGVASQACFRALYDKIDDRTVTLEWLDTTLAGVSYQPNAATYRLMAASLRAALESCVVLDHLDYVNTDFKPANTLCSGIETGKIMAKVLFPSGQRINVQPFAMRAPEVFLGNACTGPSQVWATAAMILCWVKPGILGAWDSIHPLLNEAWSMAKIKRLFPEWNIPTPNQINPRSYSLQAAVESAERMSVERPEMQAISPLEEEAQKLVMPQELRNLLRFMLVPGVEARPSASVVLASKEFLAFERVAGDPKFSG
ncbi:uncharacterized protein B0H64DRAFT_374272 [Chaetomium fimeti]|uniref:Protein kinase domain-containing protein n=1 Tax=Chaetomium fimeti TaxID=1854472 RepID=A0AAE0HGH2_9PEZI|nr:hypothetical protein B0H64DRAFT_374272 [Chaetomium fimeti]